MDTFGILLEFDYTITAYCHPCNRRVEIDLSKLPPNGKSVNRRWRCIECGQLGRVIMSPPTPKTLT